MSFFVGIGEVYVWRWSWTLALNHLYGDGRAVYSGSRLGREHFQSIQEAPVGIFEFDQGIANLKGQIKHSRNAIPVKTYVTC